MAHATDTAGPSTTAAGLSFWMLGPLSVTRSGEELRLGGRQQRAVLASLLIEAGHTVSRARLSEQLWGDDVPRGAATTIQTYVSHLRDVLEPGRAAGDPPTLLVTRNGGYRLDADPSDIDSSLFRHRLQQGQALLRSGDRGDAVAASAALQQALSLWRTDALSDLLDYPFAEEESDRLHELRLIATEALADADLRLGRDAEVIETVGPLLEGNPLRERLHEQLMLAMYRSGRQADALEVHRRLVTHLAEELGADPGPAIQALHVAILRHDRHLEAAGPSRSALASSSSAEPIAPPDPPHGHSLDPANSRRLPLRSLVAAAAWLFRVRPRAVAGTVGVVAVLAGAATMQPGTGAPPPPALAANAVSQLDESGAVAASVPVGTNPVAAASVGGAIWVTNSSDDNVYQINPATRAVEREVHVGDVPQSLAVTGHDLWVANFASGTVSRIDVLARRVVQTVHVGSGPAAIAVGAAGLWVANSGDNTIQRIDTRSGAAHDPVPVGDGPDGLAVDDRSVWVANGRAGSVTRIEVRTREPMYPPIRVGSGPRGIVRSGDDVWVADELSQSVTRISIPTTHTHSIDVGDGPTALAVHRGAVWVAEKYAGDLLRIDPDNEKTTRLDVRGAVRGLAVVAGRLWVVSGAAASPAHRGGILRVAAGPLPGHNSGIDPANVYDLTTGHAIRAVYDGLLAYHYASADSQVLVPDLATSVPEPTDGGRTYTFNLHPGVRYSTGRRVKASDFARGVQRALFAREGNSGFYAGIVGGRACIDDHRTCDLSKGVVADDAEGRVTFHLTAPDPQFNHKLTLLVVPAPPGTPMHTIATPLPGTGPYRVASYVPDKKFRLARNPYFHEWSAGAQPAGFVDGMVWEKVADARAAADAVTQGLADLAELTPLFEYGRSVGSLVDELKVTAASLVHSKPMQTTGFGVLNSSRPPFDHLQVRRAFNYAVDRAEIVRLMGGRSVATETCQLLPPSMPSYAPYCPYTRGPRDGHYHGPDLAKARELVRRSGTYGMKVTVTQLVGDYNPPFDSYFTHVLRQLGYRATLRRLPDTRRNEDFFFTSRRGSQVVSGGWIADFPLPSNFYDIVSCGANAYPSFYCNKSLDRRAAAANAMLQSDPGRALRTWTAIDRKVTDEAALMPVQNSVDWWVTSKRVGNYQSSERDVGPLMSQLWVR